ncbi:glycolipid transfer protein domain-containing protein [Lobosporangium transversale]|uniref:Glycolipid transfer protein domain-containing protein n=1 Tax=Lobosporangium transversale TaxID=64571 RepID=A0A1Y2GCC5_9FUNG|nr:glycolipid transfer protein domain-containing protein [Lobosporangium transversale]ORZ06972.1 glycolipid transfer protein domain-containing protein [Lobosporangium transversale]|eukprot:XP_021877768.1 glycolipid transfer protein domain-containing protein [Lobosporangium transversale]
MASTYFQGTRNYTDVTITDEGINTQEFLEATEGLVKIFDLFGTVFGVVQSDMNGNIKKIRDRYLQNPVVNSTLQNLVKGEIAEKKKTATEGLLWLTRGLDFTLQSLERSEANPGEELSVSFTKGYEATLRQYHGMLVRPVFTMAMKACPYRADFYDKLGSDQAAVKQDLTTYLGGLRRIVTDIQAFYTANNLK